jgi:hypothetical protein
MRALNSKAANTFYSAAERDTFFLVEPVSLYKAACVMQAALCIR